MKSADKYNFIRLESGLYGLSIKQNSDPYLEANKSVYSGGYGFFVKFGADYPDFERTTFRLNSSNPALPYISLFLFFNLFT